MRTPLAEAVEEDGILVRSAAVNGFAVTELRFAAGYVQPEFAPPRPYVAVVLGGSLVKTIGRSTVELDVRSAVTMPAGQVHGARFGPHGAHVLAVALAGPARGLPSLTRMAAVSARNLSWLARRLAAELRARDETAPLAAEGFALELLAATEREVRAERRPTAPPVWLDDAVELLEARIGGRIGLGELAQEVGVSAARLAREFRVRYGVSVGEYVRRLRIEWAAAELVRGERSLAEIAAEAGFADQSHFTRVFRRRVGTTPSRYREFQNG